MGYYLNPTGQSKAEWLGANGSPEVGAPRWSDRKPNHTFVCFSNSGFAVAILCLVSSSKFENR